MTAGDLNFIPHADSSVCSVFPGVTICFENASAAARGHTDGGNNGCILEIRHCRAGRIEFKDAHGYKYLAACDMYAYIGAHIDSPITLDTLAAEFNTSQTCIKNAYKSVFSVPFSSYLRSLRMKKAALLIRKTDISILDIAQSVGYSNPSKFAKAFRDEHGMTPVRYRKT